VRGGSIPLLAWGALLAVLMTICWIWTDDAIQVGTFAFAVTVVWGGALLLAAAGGREALRPGSPPPSPEAEAVPVASAGAVLVALAIASLVFGLAFGRFLVYFGAGVLVLGLGMVALEHVQERRARRAWLERDGGRPGS
ncbi:MAG: hypothetical protein ACXVE4_01910, partial [Solirubrobacteraceae bacterium]